METKAETATATTFVDYDCYLYYTISATTVLWKTGREILCWILDGIAQTVKLLIRKCDKILSKLRAV